MPRCLISFGANIGDARATIQHAASQLKQQLCSGAGSEFRISRHFLTPPVGGPTGQPPFINAVAAIETEASVWDVWHCIRRVEHELGRVRNQRWEARRIDLDILLYDSVRIWTPHLKVPHPRMCMRRFILLPAVDVAADWIDPVSGWTIGQLADNLRFGAGNLTLVADPESSSESLLAEVAAQAGARWLVDGRLNAPGTAELSASRWVASHCERISRSEDLALSAALSGQILRNWLWCWHHRLRIWMSHGKIFIGVLRAILGCARRAGWAEDGFHGPRYLLMSDDRNWAIAELVAALEAMDCPIESL